MPMDGTQQATQNFGIPYTGAFTNAGGGGGGLGAGYGKFGNLDENKWKPFTKKVYKGPITGWEMDTFKGYWDPTSNTYKTYAGKNIKHAGLFTGDPKKGDIEGEDFQFPSITGGIMNWLRNKKDQIGGVFSGGQASQADIDAANKEQAQNIGATTVAPQHQQEQGGGGYQDTPTHSAKEAMAEGIDVGAGGMMGPGGKHYAQGGRIGFEEGGWSPGVGRDEQGYQSTHSSFEGGQGDGNNQGNTGGITQLVDTDLISTSPSAEINYSPNQLAQLHARLYNKNVLTDDDIKLEGDVTGGIGPIDYGINFTDEGVTGSNVEMGPLNVDIDPNKNIRNISFDQDLGNFNFQGNTDLENYGLGVNYKQGPFFCRW